MCVAGEVDRKGGVTVGNKPKVQLSDLHPAPCSRLWEVAEEVNYIERWCANWQLSTKDCSAPSIHTVLAGL